MMGEYTCAEKASERDRGLAIGFASSYVHDIGSSRSQHTAVLSWLVHAIRRPRVQKCHVIS